jgi:murein L,D-transpeptidase YcbB/YkuD
LEYPSNPNKTCKKPHRSTPSLIYGLGDTELFAKSERSFSSGCVRLQDPLRVGEILLQYNRDAGIWDQSRIEHAIATKETRFVSLTQRVPIYFLYWTVFPDDIGQINFRKDIYGYDSLLIASMTKPAEKPENR